MTTTPLRPPVRLHEPGELIAAVPHMLGFHPQDSLVLLALKGDQPNKVGLTLRVDLPPARHRRALADQLLLPVHEHESSAVLVLVVGGGPADPPAVPHRELIEVLSDALATIGVPLVHAAWAESTGAGASWRCYDDAECAGTVPDPRGTALAAATAAAGLVTFASRDELAALLTPDDESDLARRSAMLDHAAEAAERTGSDPRAALRRVREAVERTAERDGPLDDEEIVDLAVALTDLRVRDACLALVTDGSAAAAESLWLKLSRSMPVPERAEAAALLAFSAYVRGEGALASVALEQAEAASPGHRLAHLLRMALDTGLAPSKVATIASNAAAEASWLLADDQQR
jgi:hypothetical protein